MVLPLVIDVISAKDLKKVNPFGKTHAYAVVSLSGDPRASKQQRTAVDKSGNVSPTWNDPLTFFVEESATLNNPLSVTFILRSKWTLGDKEIGEVRVPLSDLIGPTEDGELLQSVTYQVQRPCGKPNKGELNFTYKWGEKMASAPAMEINTAYTAQVGPSHISPAPHPGYANPPPLQYSGYPPVQQPQNNSWWAKVLGVELVKLCLGDLTADCFGSDPGVPQ